MPTDLKTVLQLSVPLKVRVGELCLSMDDVLALGPGAILDLEKSADGELDVLINNKHVGEGHAVKIGENFGIRVTRLGDRRELAQAMVGRKK